MNYKKIKRPKVDRCNICGKNTKLTWDHVPPKACNNCYSVKVNSLFAGIPQVNQYEEQFQNGVKFRSLCNECNNGFLGAKYDPAYYAFIGDMSKMLLSQVQLPIRLTLNAEINKVARAVCGHILAAKHHYNDVVGTIDNDLREYLFDESRKRPRDLFLYYWVYPYSSVVVIRDVAIKSYTTDCPEGVVSVLSFFPISFILTTELSPGMNMPDLFTYTTTSINGSVNVPIDFQTAYYPKTQKLRNHFWPCNVSDGADGTAMVLVDSTNVLLMGVPTNRKQKII